MTATERLRKLMGNRFPVVAHARYGDGRKEGRPPENTLSAFVQALNEGADAIETDIQITSDGEFVLIHDGDVDRTTNGKGRVENMTLAEIKELRASYGREEFAEERILTLAELANIVGETGLLLEIKSDHFLGKRIARRFVAELDRLGILEQTAIVSFSWERIQAIRKVDPNIPIGWITKGHFFWPRKGTEMVGPVWPLLFLNIILNPFYIWIIHKRGQVICPLDPTPEKWKKLWLYKFLRCDAVLTNEPAKTLQKLGRA